MTIDAGSVAGILPAAGKSSRFGAQEKKIFQLLGDRPVWYHAAAALRRRPEVGPIVIAIAADDEETWRSRFAAELRELDATLVIGGAERFDSVLAALRQVAGAQWVAIHDAARPLLPHDDLSRLFAAATEHGAAILAAPARATLKQQSPMQIAANQPVIGKTIDRRGIWEALTPQMFRYDIITAAYDRWRGFPVTDDAQMVERAGHPVALVEGSPANLKITVSDDLEVARALWTLSNSTSH